MSTTPIPIETRPPSHHNTSNSSPPTPATKPPHWDPRSFAAILNIIASIYIFWYFAKYGKTDQCAIIFFKEAAEGWVWVFLYLWIAASVPQIILGLAAILTPNDRKYITEYPTPLPTLRPAPILSHQYLRTYFHLLAALPQCTLAVIFGVGFFATMFPRDVTTGSFVALLLHIALTALQTALSLYCYTIENRSLTQFQADVQFKNNSPTATTAQQQYQTPNAQSNNNNPYAYNQV